MIKKCLIGAMSVFTLVGNAQIQPSINCHNAQNGVITNSVQSITQSGTNGWFYFIPSKTNTRLRIKNVFLPNYGGKIITATAYSGKCNSLTEIANVDITASNDSILLLDLNNLSITDTVYLFTKKKYSPKQCSTSPSNCNHDAIFEIGIQEEKDICKEATGITPSSLTLAQKAIYNKIVSHNIYSSINFIKLNNIEAVADNGFLKISLPFLYCNNLVFEASSVNYTNPANYSWVGKSINLYDTICSYGNFTLMKNNDLFIGHLAIESRSYELFDLTDGIQVICETNIIKAPRNDCALKTLGVNTPNQTASGACVDGSSKVLILYTPAALALESDMNGRANLCVSQLNQNWYNSNIYNTISLASVQPLNFTESGDIDVDIAALKNNSSAQALRNLYKAETVILLTSNGYTSYGIVADIAPAFSDAYGIVNIVTSTTSRYTFAHEFTHLFGGRHDDDNTNSAKGFKFKTGTGWFGWGGTKRSTLMVSGANLGWSNNVRIENTSNPNVVFIDAPSGDASHDNASQVNSLKNYIGGFYLDALPSTPIVSLVHNGSSCNNWNASIEVCTGLIPVSYYWYKSFDGISWTPITLNASTTGGSLNTFNFNLNSPHPHFVKVDMKNASGVILYTVQKNMHFWETCWASRLAHKGDELTIDDEEYLNTLNVFPNPASSSISLEIISSKDDKINTSVYSTNGQLVLFKENQTFKKGIDKQELQLNLPSGIYLIKVSGTNLNFIKKIIIQ